MKARRPADPVSECSPGGPGGSAARCGCRCCRTCRRCRLTPGLVADAAACIECAQDSASTFTLHPLGHQSAKFSPASCTAVPQGNIAAMRYVLCQPSRLPLPSPARRAASGSEHCPGPGVARRGRCCRHRSRAWPYGALAASWALGRPASPVWPLRARRLTRSVSLSHAVLSGQRSQAAPPRRRWRRSARG